MDYPSRIPKPEDDQFDEYGVSEMKERWKEWGEDVEGSGQVLYPNPHHEDCLAVLVGRCCHDDRHKWT